jgi:hypothetical protein
MAMPDCLFWFALASAVLAIWTYSRAHRMHREIEARYPGLNEQMRRTCSTLRRWGLKR